MYSHGSNDRPATTIAFRPHRQGTPQEATRRSRHLSASPLKMNSTAATPGTF